MALNLQSTALLIKESQRRAFGGTLLSLGEQDIRFGGSELEELASRYRYRLLKPEGPLQHSAKRSMKEKGHLSMGYLFRCLGFDRVESCDCSEYEGADFVFDMNSDAIDAERRETYDVVLNGGTLEHLYHIPNAMKNMHDFLKVGGRAMHVFAPALNYMEHGFYQFSCTFFLDYYSVNKYSIETLQVVRHSLSNPDAPFWVADYSPSAFSYSNSVNTRTDGDCGYVILCVATKHPDSTGDAIPQQSHYLREWSGSRDGSVALQGEDKGK